MKWKNFLLSNYLIVYYLSDFLYYFIEKSSCSRSILGRDGENGRLGDGLLVYVSTWVEVFSLKYWERQTNKAVKEQSFLLNTNNESWVVIW